MRAYNIIYECKNQMHIQKILVVTSNLQLVINDIEQKGTIKSVQLVGEVVIYD